jgi:hypothetical protein
MSSAVIGVTGLVAAGVGAAGIAAGAIESSNAASDQRNAANQANQTLQSQFNTTNANQAPFRAAGLQAVGAEQSYLGLPGAAPFNQSTLSNLPGYQFALNQGVQAVDRSQAAAGMLNSGATGKALTQYGQGLAGQYGQQYLGGLQSLASLGEGATQSTAAAGAQAASQISGNQIYAGQAQAAGDINTSNSIAISLNQGSGLYGLAQGGFFNQRQPQGTAGLNYTYNGMPNSGYTQTMGGQTIPQNGAPGYFNYQATIGAP